MPKICEFETCRDYANYGHFYGKPIRCKEHKEEYRLVSQLCRGDICKLYCNFNFKGEKNALYCSEHKLDGMVDIKHTNCIHLNCKTHSNYNYDGEKSALYCATHKLKGMVNVRSKTCEHPNCKKIPVFNYSGEKRALYCLEHKLEGMINIVSKTCNHPNCKTHPIYNYNGKKSALYCLEHKLEGMINVKNKTCVHPNCKKQPTYNYNDKQTSLYCSEHKLEGMINIVSKTCEQLNCKKQPTYNYSGETIALYCLKHKLNGMVDVKHKTCIYPNCKTRPTYNYYDDKSPLFCSEHQKEGMVDVTNKKCKANYCLGNRANSKYKGYCVSCYQNLFPNDPLSLQMFSKTKELTVRQFININFEGFQHDKPLWTGNCDCTHRRRIDHRKLIGNTLLCIETDENQHKGYNKDDEEIRYDDLYMLHSGKFIFIRFNPDKFKNKKGKNLNPMLYTRLPVLKEEIEKQIKRIENEENKDLLEIIKLYYDE